jgi:hypothetical protein
MCAPHWFVSRRVGCLRLSRAFGGTSVARRRGAWAVNRYVAACATINAALAVVFIVLNQAALSAQLEETFVALAAIYGVAVTLINTVFVAWLAGKSGR